MGATWVSMGVIVSFREPATKIGASSDVTLYSGEAFAVRSGSVHVGGSEYGLHPRYWGTRPSWTGFPVPSTRFMAGDQAITAFGLVDPAVVSHVELGVLCPHH